MQRQIYNEILENYNAVVD